jgi:hypothetical protein
LLPIFNSIEVLLSSFTPAGNHSIGYIISYHNGDLVNSFLPQLFFSLILSIKTSIYSPLFKQLHLPNHTD